MRKLTKSAADDNGLYRPCQSQETRPPVIDGGVRSSVATYVGRLRFYTPAFAGKLRFLTIPDVIPTVLIKIAEAI